MKRHVALAGLFAFAVIFLSPSTASWADEPQRLLLLAQGPDGHPPGTHEYVPGLEVLAECLQAVDGLEVAIVRADEPWSEGPALLAKSNGAVVFVSEGAKWLSDDSARLAAFRELASRSGGLTVLHWGMGTRSADNIAAFVELFGACHGGPNRKYQVVDAELSVASPSHEITRGLENLNVHDEFYYRLKLPTESNHVVPIMRARIEGRPEMVAWAYERPAGGRSFGFSGLHFHDNWRHEMYRRLVVQGVLWTLGRSIPAEGASVEIDGIEISEP